MWTFNLLLDGLVPSTNHSPRNNAWCLQVAPGETITFTIKEVFGHAEGLAPGGAASDKR